MSVSTDAADLTSDSQADHVRPEESLFSTTAPESLRRVSSSSSELSHPEYSTSLSQQQLDCSQEEEDSLDQPLPAATATKPNNSKRNAMGASQASSTTAVGGQSGMSDGTARQTLTLREQEKVGHDHQRQRRGVAKP